MSQNPTVTIHAIFRFEIKPITVLQPKRSEPKELIPWLIAIQEHEEVAALKTRRMRPRHFGAQLER